MVIVVFAVSNSLSSRALFPSSRNDYQESLSHNLGGVLSSDAARDSIMIASQSDKRREGLVRL